MSEARNSNTTTASRRSIAAAGLAVLGLAAAPAASQASAQSTDPIDPVVAMWARLQAINAELERVSDQHQALHALIESRRPGQPEGMAWVDWHRGDPDLARSTALLNRSNELCGVSSDLYDEIGVAVAVTPAGIRAKCAAALSIWASEKALHEECGFAELILNALREAAAGSAAA